MDSEEIDTKIEDTLSITSDSTLSERKPPPIVSTTKQKVGEKPKAGSKNAERWLSVVQSTVATTAQRQAIVSSAQSGATSAGQSKTVNSVNDLGAFSAAIKQATLHLDQILREGTVDNELGVQVYLSKLEAHALSKLPQDVYREYTPTAYHYTLIREAASASKKVYEQNFFKKILYNVMGDDKACFTHVVNLRGKNILIISVRGTACLADILLDVNYKPNSCKQLLNGTYSWHTGFLRVAQNMESRIAADIKATRKSTPAPSAVLLTGHSLGGAIAQILLAMSHSKDTQICKVLEGLEVNCITFGAPPVSTIPITPTTYPTPNIKPGLFLSIINEGDPIPLAQESYINTLISIYALSPQDFEANYGTLDEPPNQLYHVSGQCVVLRDEEPDDETSSSIGFKAVRVENDVVESRLFGNPFMHFMDEYLRLLEGLKAGSGDDKEED